MVISDYPSVMELWSRTENMLLREADTEDNIAKYLKRNPGLSFVAEKELNIVGAVLAGTDGRRGYIQHLAVSNQNRGKGIGKRLIQNTISALEKEGIFKTHLFVTNQNTIAQNFYKSIGWHSRHEIVMFSFNASLKSNI